MASKKTVRAVQPPFGPWDYYAGSIYDLGRHDLAAAGVTTYAQAEAPTNTLTDVLAIADEAAKTSDFDDDGSEV